MKRLAILSLLLQVLLVGGLGAGPAAAEGFLPTKKTMTELINAGFQIVSTTTVPNPSNAKEATLVFTLTRQPEIYLCRFKLLDGDAPYGQTRCFELRTE